MLAESVKLSVAERVPAVVGLNMIFAVQLADAPRLEPQVLLKIAKSPALVPVIATLLIVIAAVPLFVSVATFWPPAFPTATLAQVRLVGLTVACARQVGAYAQHTSVATKDAFRNLG